MQLYLDTADRQAAESLLATGLFAGLTTNPTILQRAGLGMDAIGEVHRWAQAAGAKEIFFQPWGTTAAELERRGRELRELGDDVVVKFAASRAGASACATLAAEGIPTLLTAVYSPGQALIAAAAGATYIAPYVGRLQSAGRDAIAEVTAMQEVLAPTTTRILAASLRDVTTMVTLARRGVDAFTMAPAVAEEFFADAMTAEAVVAFELAAGGQN